MRRHIPERVKLKKTPKTKEILFFHTKKRLRERYRFICDRDTYNLFSNKIGASNGKSNDCECLHRQSRKATVWKVLHGEHTFIFVYDKVRNAIITALPPEATDYNYER